MPAPRRILILAPAPAQPLDVAGPAEVFTQATGFGAPYEVEVAIVPGTGAGPAWLAPGRPLAYLVADPRPVDTLILGGGEGARTRAGEPALQSAVQHLARRARRVASVCTGAFVLAQTGRLDGRRATTHWRWCDDLARRHPAILVDPEPIYIRDGDLWTSAGVTAGMDLALALLEEDHGHAPALAVARELVLFLRRPGTQKQFSTPLAAQAAPTAKDLVAWLAENLHRPITVDAMAAHARQSPRTFARTFARATGVPPGQMLDRLRVDAARSRLEQGPAPLAAIAATCGFGTEEAMRRAFLRHVGTPPGAYRDRFRPTPNQSCPGLTRASTR